MLYFTTGQAAGTVQQPQLVLQPPPHAKSPAVTSVNVATTMAAPKVATPVLKSAPQTVAQITQQAALSQQGAAASQQGAAPQQTTPQQQPPQSPMFYQS